jgi:hypothetical protein
VRYRNKRKRSREGGGIREGRGEGEEGEERLEKRGGK